MSNPKDQFNLSNLNSLQLMDTLTPKAKGDFALELHNKITSSIAKLKQPTLGDFLHIVSSHIQEILDKNVSKPLKEDNWDAPKKKYNEYSKIILEMARYTKSLESELRRIDKNFKIPDDIVKQFIKATENVFEAYVPLANSLHHVAGQFGVFIGINSLYRDDATAHISQDFKESMEAIFVERYQLMVQNEQRNVFPITYEAILKNMFDYDDNAVEAFNQKVIDRHGSLFIS